MSHIESVAFARWQQRARQTLVLIVSFVNVLCYELWLVRLVTQQQYWNCFVF